MAVPKRKTSKMKSRKRRTHYTPNIPTLSICPRCRSTIRPHSVCPGCGFYRNREVISIAEKKERESNKEEAREGNEPR
jgi:large subunit ribosomal protein L32